MSDQWGWPRQLPLAIPPFRRAFDAARDPLTARNALGITSTGGGGTGDVSSVPTPVNGQLAQWTDATHIQGVNGITLAQLPQGTNGQLLVGITGSPPAWRTITGDILISLSGATSLQANTVITSNIVNGAVTYAKIQDVSAAPRLLGRGSAAGAGDVEEITVGSGLSMTGTTLAATGSGNVSNSGTPTSGQYAKWTGATTIEGVTPATVLSDIGAQPLDGDLTAIAALAGTNTIYYRSAANTWSAVTIGGNMTFSGGTLNSVAGGSGNVSNSGTPTAGQIAQWTDATHIQGVASSTIGFGPPQGRLTLGGLNAPVMIVNYTGLTTIIYVPYIGDKVPIYDGTSWAMMSSNGGIGSSALSDTTKNPSAIGASKVNDWFIWNDGGTIRLGHGPDWTSDTARSAGTVLVMVNGIWLNNAAITNGPAAQRGTYVGTTRSNASSQLDWIYGAISAGGTTGFFGVWNCYNRRLFATIVGETADSWTYSSGTNRQPNGDANFKVSFVRGLDEDAILAQYSVGALGSGTFSAFTSIALDSTSTPVAAATKMRSSGAASIMELVVRYSGFPGAGFHFITPLEASGGAGAVTFYGDDGGGQQGAFQMEFMA